LAVYAECFAIGNYILRVCKIERPMGLRKATSKCGCQTTCVWPPTKQQNQKQTQRQNQLTNIEVKLLRHRCLSDTRNGLVWRPLGYRKTDGKMDRKTSLH